MRYSAHDLEPTEPLAKLRRIVQSHRLGFLFAQIVKMLGNPNVNVVPAYHLERPPEGTGQVCGIPGKNRTTKLSHSLGRTWEPYKPFVRRSPVSPGSRPGVPKTATAGVDSG